MTRVPDSQSRDLVPLNSHELAEVRIALRAPRAMQAIEARDERVIVSPYPLRQTFKAVASALRTRLYHGTSQASPPIEDMPSGTLRGRRAFLEGTPSATRLLMGVPLVGQVLANWILDVEVRVTEQQGQVLVGFRLRTTLPQSIGHNVTGKEFEGLIADFQRLLPTISLGSEVVADPIIGPGESTPDAFTGTLRDYSRCATVGDVGLLRSGDFPLGRYLWPAADAHGSVPLFLGAPHNARGQELEHLIFRNVCVTAPVGMGKSYSIFRPWSVAAARAGFSSLVFDPKGDLTQDLREPVFAAGNRVVIFSTSPEQPSVNWNFMDEVEIDAQGRLKSRRAVEAILDALLPRENAESDKEEFASRLFRGWLGGFIQIAKYALGDGADPFVLYQMARDDDRLKELLQMVRDRWGESIHERLYYEVNDLFDKFEWGYTAQLRGVANALAPFVQDPLRNRTRARPGERRFRITDLDRRPTTLFLSCPLRDLQAAQRVGSVATSLLLSHIYERKPPAAGQPDTRVPLLLLLDETRLLSANLAEFLAVGRGFKAGVVTCYQELDQIRDESSRREILTNSNTLICLRGIGPGSRKALMERLSRATIQVAGVGASVGEEARQQANVNLSRQEVAVLGEYEVRAMPGPQHVALVHVQDGTVADAKPFLVDLTDNGSAAAPPPPWPSSAGEATAPPLLPS
jgi:hypothetical protein